MSIQNRAITHVLKRLQADGRLAYLIGPGSESFDLITQAYAEERGLDIEEFRKSFAADLKYEPWPDQGREAALEEVLKDVTGKLSGLITAHLQRDTVALINRLEELVAKHVVLVNTGGQPAATTH